MENNRNPQQETPAVPLPEESLSALEPEIREEVPVIEELSFTESVYEEIPSADAAFPAQVQKDCEEGPVSPLSEEAAVPAEETSVIEEVSVAEEVPVVEEMPVMMSALFPEEEPVSDVPVASVFPEEEPAYVAGEGNTASFMDRIPDVEDDFPEENASEEQETASAEPEQDLIAMPGTPLPEEVSAMEVPAEEIPDPEPGIAADNKKKQQERVTLKGRPKRKKGEGFLGIPNILVTFVWLALVLAIGVTLGRMLWVCAADVLAFGRPDQQVTITVYEADSMDDITEKLYNAGLIRYRSLFNLYAGISDAREDIKPGIYDLNTRYDYHALVNFMSPSSTRQVVELTIPEGYTCRQIFALLEENRVCTAVDIAAYAADGELSDYWFLEGVERGSEYCLEGYLFPDTYQFYKNSSPREALEKMLDNFEYRFSEEMRAQIDVLNANVTDGTYTVREIVIVASLIEKESAAASESPTIASVIYNRLFNWEYPALLNIDAAIVYAQGGNSDTIDTGIDSPYNTYRYTGLTPTAIANPGLSSLKAALNPESTNFYFYVLNPATGMHQFSTTQAEHDAWIAEFYN